MRRPRRSSSRRRTRSRWRLVGDVLLALGLLFAVGLVALRGIEGASRTLEGRFAVIDGDSLMLGGERLRLEGIDAPERGQACRRDGRDYDCGAAAREALGALMPGAGATCSGWRRDAYGRLLVRCADGETDINAKMVETGWAVAYGDYAAQERAARAAGRGIWAGEFDRPRLWRQGHGRPAEDDHGGLRTVFDAVRRWLAI